MGSNYRNFLSIKSIQAITEKNKLSLYEIVSSRGQIYQVLKERSKPVLGTRILHGLGSGNLNSSLFSDGNSLVNFNTLRNYYREIFISYLSTWSLSVACLSFSYWKSTLLVLIITDKKLVIRRMTHKV